MAAATDGLAVVLQAAEAREAPPERAMRLALLAGLARRPRWLAGTALMTLEWPLQVLALSFAPITVVQPALSASQLVLLALARVKLRERVGRPEVLGAMLIVAGLGLVVAGAPRHTTVDADPGPLAAPLAVVGGGAVGAYLMGRRRQRGLWLVIGAGLAYAWVDFVNKLLANDFSTGNWVLVVVWLAAAGGVGALAFLQENSALQLRPATTVAPVIGALKEPVPVLMALWAGVEAWGSSTQRLALLVGGLALASSGAVMLGRSRAVARVAGHPEAERVANR